MERALDFDALATAYVGPNALSYNDERVWKPRWKDEQAAIAELFDELPDGLRALDVPVGTGRTFPFYKQKGFAVTGLDISPDMLSEARTSSIKRPASRAETGRYSSDSASRRSL